MAGWRPGPITATRGPKPPKVGKKGSPVLAPAPVTRAAAVAAEQYQPGGASTAKPGGTPFMFPAGVTPWKPTPTAPGKAPSQDMSWQDSPYNTALANLLSQRDQGKQSLIAAGRRAAEDRARNKSLLTEGRGKAKTAARQSANKSGLFYSGTLGKNLGDVDTDFDRRATDVDTAFTRGEEDRAAASAGLDTAFNQAQQSAAQQAIDRWINGAAATESASTPSLDALIAALANLNTTPARRR